MAADNWHPMDSAPKDRAILAFQNGFQAVICWGEYQDTSVWPSRPASGWILDGMEGHDPYEIPTYQPTHWRDLPDPPASGV